MKTYLLKLVALALFAASLTGAALAQDSWHQLRANIPFSFDVGGKVMPAGEYTLSVDIGRRSVILGQYASGYSSFLLASPGENSRDSRTLLIFQSENGEAYTLRAVKSPDWGLSLRAVGSRHTMRVQNQNSQPLEVIAEAK